VQLAVVPLGERKKDTHERKEEAAETILTAKLLVCLVCCRSAYPRREQRERESPRERPPSALLYVPPQTRCAKAQRTLACPSNGSLFPASSPLTLVSMPPSVLKGLLAAANSFDAGVRHSQVIEGFYVFTEDSTPSRGSFPDAIGTGYHWVSFATSEQALRAITLVSAVITHEQWIERVNHEHIARNPLQVALPHASAQFLVPTDFFYAAKSRSRTSRT